MQPAHRNPPTTPKPDASGAPIVRLGLPKGVIEAGVTQLLNDAGIGVRATARSYRPAISLPGFEAKQVKPQNIVEMLHLGRRDLGFAGRDWVEELSADVVELLDTGLDPVRIVAAAPADMLVEGSLPARDLVIASEYEHLTRRWIAARGLSATFVRAYGATEVFPPDDADCIVDNTASGATLRANGLTIIDELMTSSTRLFAHPRALDDPRRRDAIERFVQLVRSVLEARRRVMLEVNVTRDALAAVVDCLPCMRHPTVSPLHAESGFAVKAAVPRDALPQLIPEIKRRGGTDIVVTALSHLVP